MLEGKIERQGFLDIIQLLTMSRKTGRLEITGVAEGSLFFSDGQLLDCHMGNLVGDDAFVELFILVSGNFKFHEEDIASTRHITKSLTDLLTAASIQASEWDMALLQLPYEDAALILTPVDPEANNHFKLDALGWAIISQVNGRRSFPEIARLLAQSKTRIAISVANLKNQGLITLEDEESALLRTVFRKTADVLYRLMESRVKARTRERALNDFNKWAFAKGFDIRILTDEGVVNNIPHDMAPEYKSVAYRQSLEQMYEAAQAGLSRNELRDHMAELYEKLSEPERRVVAESGLSKFLGPANKKGEDSDFWEAPGTIGTDGIMPR